MLEGIADRRRYFAKFTKWIAPLARRGTVRARLGHSGFQEARVTIRGRYQPATVSVAQGVPVRLRFFRDEDTPCSEHVIFAGIGIERRLPAFKETVVEFVPEEPGEFLFTCEMGMFRGRLIVSPDKRSARRQRA